jgi:hypothetical protein
VLFQIIGRAPADLGAVNVTTADASLIVIRSPALFAGSNTTVLGAITPSRFDLAACRRPSPARPRPSI